MERTIVEVYAAANTPQAYLVKAALADAGIEAQVVGDMLQGAAGDIPLGLVSAPRIWVTEEHAEAAKQVVAAWEVACAQDRPVVEKTTWKCPGCGTEVEGDFDVCWNCQHAR